jgi:hypothetical protein
MMSTVQGDTGNGAVIRGKNDSREHGATLVEMAIVLPLLLLLVLGLMEIGLAFKSYLSVSSAARDGSRMAAVMGRDALADCETLKAVATVLEASGELDALEYIDIFDAGTDGNQNLATTNRYSLTGADPSDCGSWALVGVEGWPWSVRETKVTNTLDLAGVRIVSDHNWVTGFPPFQGSVSIDETTITRLEPEEF